MDEELIRRIPVFYDDGEPYAWQARTVRPAILRRSNGFNGLSDQQIVEMSAEELLEYRQVLVDAKRDFLDSLAE